MSRRKTDFTLEELKGMILGHDTIECEAARRFPGCCRGHSGMIPRGLAINEVGNILREGDQKAEDILQILLGSDNPGDASIAYFHLSYLDKTTLNPATVELMKKFEENPENQNILEQMKARKQELLEEEAEAC